MDYLSPIGVLRITASDRGLRSIRFVSDEHTNYEERDSDNTSMSNFYTAACYSCLTNYFAKLWGAFEQARAQIPLDISGTPLQKKIWGTIYSLPQTHPQMNISYAELSYLAGERRTARTIGKTCSENPIPILIPCHRVVLSNGELGEYIGGTSKKSWLLWHEGLHRNIISKFDSSFLQIPPQTR